MSSLGSHLRELRERRGYSLDEIARATRISRSNLEALEASAVDKLPAAVITRGFIRAYCEVLGERHEQALTLYDGRVCDMAPPKVETRKRDARSPRRHHGPVLVSFVLLV